MPERALSDQSIGPYFYENLGDDDFQKLCATLLVKEFGRDVRCWPVGQKDGGRDVTRTAGSGDVVYQVKWAKAAPRNPVSWLEGAVKGEADKIDALVRDGARQYVLMTSIPGTSAKAGWDGTGSGSIDRFDEVLEKYRVKFGLATMDCWWRDDIDTRVNLFHPSTLLHFAKMLSGADALRLLSTAQHEALAQNEIASLLRVLISMQWSQDRKVKFKQAELDNDSLQALFVDVHAAVSPPLTRFGTNPLTTSSAPREVGGAVQYLAKSSTPFVLVQGEPGQGKSTMGQYLCQIYRSEFVADDAADSTDRPAIRPAAARVPIRVDLRDYAAWLNGEDPFSSDPAPPRGRAPKRRSRGEVERFLQVLVADLAVVDSVSLALIHELVDRFPVFLVFDGLDEVGQSDVRDRVVGEIEQFIGRYRRDAVMTPRVVVTTRPNVANLAEPSRDLFELMVLKKLDDSLRTQYLRNWCAARGIEKRDKRELMRTFDKRKVEPHIAQLTNNPMQLTILLYLLHRQGRSVPDRRTQLYDEYMATSLTREADKTPSVQANRIDLEEVTAFLGWQLQGTAELDNSAGRVPTRQLRSRIFEYLDRNEKDIGLVDALFTDVTDRVWVLTSKVQGTFEFDVQPVREFFAAKYLYRYAAEHKSRILTELTARPFWFNTSRFFAGFANPNEVSGLVDGLEESRAAGRHPLSDRVTVWTLLADGVFAQRPKAQQRAVGLLLDDLSIRLLSIALQTRDRLPAMPADRGAALYHQLLLDAVAGSPDAPLARERIAIAASLGVESTPVGQWWLDHALEYLGSAMELAWLRVGVPVQAGRFLSSEHAESLRLSDPNTASAAIAAGVAPPPGSAAQASMIAAVLAGHCGDVVAPNTGLVADLTNALAPREFINLARVDDQSVFALGSSHSSTVMAPEKRRGAFGRLGRAEPRLSRIQATMNSARRSGNTVAPWGAAADQVREVYGPCWLAGELATIGAAISVDQRRDTGTWTSKSQPFGPDIQYSRYVNDVRQYRRDAGWWRDCHDSLVGDDRTLWVHALMSVADASVVADCLGRATDVVIRLDDNELGPLLNSSSRLGLSGISRRLPVNLVREAAGSLPTALLIAHHADRLVSMRSDLVDAFEPEQAAAAAAYGPAAWPTMRAAGNALHNTSSQAWLDVLCAYGPVAVAGVATGPDDAHVVDTILSSAASIPLQWVHVAEQVRSQTNEERPLRTVALGWFDE